MLKHKSDDELEILEKLMKKEQRILIALPLLTKQRMTAKQRKHPHPQCQEY